MAAVDRVASSTSHCLDLWWNEEEENEQEKEDEEDELKAEIQGVLVATILFLQEPGVAVPVAAGPITSY